MSKIPPEEMGKEAFKMASDDRERILALEKEVKELKEKIVELSFRPVGYHSHNGFPFSGV